jgi:PAS domain S-box-containing protein
MQMTGYQTDELLGKSLHQLLYHSRPDGTKYPNEECILSKAFETGEPVHVMGELLWRKDGTSFPAEHWAHPLQTTSSPTVAVFTVWDITEGQHTQEVLVQSWRPFLGTRSRKICSGGAYMWMERIQPEDFGRVDQAFHALLENQKLFPRIRVNLVRFKRVACDLRHHSYGNDGTKFGSRSFRVLLRVRAR